MTLGLFSFFCVILSIFFLWLINLVFIYVCNCVLKKSIKHIDKNKNVVSQKLMCELNTSGFLLAILSIQQLDV